MGERIKEIIIEFIQERIKPLWLRIRSLLFLFSLLLLLILSWELREILLFQRNQGVSLIAEGESFPLITSIIGNNPLSGSSGGSQVKTDKLIKVSITGSVGKPGIYEVKQGSVIADLISTAGGVTKDADTSYLARNLNLARELQAQEQIYIPNKQDQVIITQLANLNQGLVSASPNPQSSPVGTKINLNTASLDLLDTLPGIGQSTAQKIISARPFLVIEDIKKVSGIGDATFEKIKDLIEV